MNFLKSLGALRDSRPLFAYPLFKCATLSRWDSRGRFRTACARRLLAASARGAARPTHRLPGPRFCYMGEAFLLTVGPFLLTVNLLRLQSLKALNRRTFPL